MHVSEHILPGACCLHCRTAAVIRVQDEEGDVYQKCLACGRHNLRIPAGLPRSPAYDCHRSTARRLEPVPPEDEGYNKPDSGCAAAARRLGRRARCLECPFTVCHLESLPTGLSNREERLRVVALLRQGKTPAEAAAVLGMRLKALRDHCVGLRGGRV